MPERIAESIKIYLGGWNLWGDHDSSNLNLETEVKPNTRFSDGANRVSAPGMKMATFESSGYYEAGVNKIDEVLFNRFDLRDKQILSVAPTDGAQGETLYTMQVSAGSYSPFPGAQVGEILRFDLSAMARDLFLRATVLETGLHSADLNGTGRNLGSVAAGKKAYAVLHVFSVTGTLDVKIQSEADNNWLSPIDQIVFAQASTKGAQLLSVAGSIADTWWRAIIDLSVGGSADLAIGLAIQ